MKETLNLLPLEITIGVSKKKGLFFYLFWGLAAYSGVMIILWIFNISDIKKGAVEINKLNRQKNDLQQKIQPPPIISIVPSVDKEILEAMGKAPKWSPVLSTLSVVVPEDVWLASIESKEEKGARQMTIKGFSATQLGIANLISALESSHYFYGVEIVFAQKGEKDISFELKTRLKWG